MGKPRRGPLKLRRPPGAGWASYVSLRSRTGTLGHPRSELLYTAVAVCVCLFGRYFEPGLPVPYVEIELGAWRGAWRPCRSSLLSNANAARRKQGANVTTVTMLTAGTLVAMPVPAAIGLGYSSTNYYYLHIIYE